MPSTKTTPAQIDFWRAAKTETEHLEFKEAKNRFDFKRLLAYCVAMANERGGILLLGIKDKPPRPVVGTNAFLNTVQTKQEIFNKLRFRVDIEEVQHPGGRVLVFHIPSRPTGHPYELDGTYYMRNGESLVAMSPDRIKEIIKEEESAGRKAVPYLIGVLVLIVVVLVSLRYWDAAHRPVPSPPLENKQPPLLASFEYKNILSLSSVHPTQSCYGYELLVQPETDNNSRAAPLESVHLAVRFPRLVKDFRVALGNSVFASVIKKNDSGCRFIEPPSAKETVNAKTAFDIHENEFSFDARSFNETVWAEFLTDEGAVDWLGKKSPINTITRFPALIEYDGFYRYSGNPDSSIQFQLVGIDTFYAYRIKNSSPETFSIVHGEPVLGMAKSITRPMEETQLREELARRGKKMDEIEAIIKYAREHEDEWAPAVGGSLTRRR